MKCQVILSKQVQIPFDKLKYYNYQLLMNSHPQNPTQFFQKLQDLILIPGLKILTHNCRQNMNEKSFQNDIRQSLQDLQTKGGQIYRIIDYYLSKIELKQKNLQSQFLSTKFKISKIKLYQRFSYQLLTKRIKIKNKIINSYFSMADLKELRKKLQWICTIINQSKQKGRNINTKQIQFEICLVLNDIQIAENCIENWMPNKIQIDVPNSQKNQSNQCSKFKIQIVKKIYQLYKFTNQIGQYPQNISFTYLKQLFKIAQYYSGGRIPIQNFLKIQLDNFHKFIDIQLEIRHDEIIKNHYGLCNRKQYKNLHFFTRQSYKANQAKVLLPVIFSKNRTEYVILRQLYLLLRTRQQKFIRIQYQKQHTDIKERYQSKKNYLTKDYKNQLQKYFLEVTTNIEYLKIHLKEYSKMVLDDITCLKYVIYHLLQYQAPLLERIQFFLIQCDIRNCFYHFLTSFYYPQWSITDIQRKISRRVQKYQQHIVYSIFDLQKIQQQIKKIQSKEERNFLEQILAFLKLNQFLSLNRQKIQAYKQGQKSKQSYTAYKQNRYKQLAWCIQQFSSSKEKSHLQQIKDKILLLIAQYLMDDFQSLSIDYHNQKKYVILRNISPQIQNLIISMVFKKEYKEINKMNNSKWGRAEITQFKNQSQESSSGYSQRSQGQQQEKEYSPQKKIKDFTQQQEKHRQNSTSIKRTESFVQPVNIQQDYRSTEDKIIDCLKKNNNQTQTRTQVRNQLSILKQDLFLLKMKEKSLERCLIANQYQSFLKKHFQNPNQQSIISKIIKIQRHFYLGQYNEGWVLYQLQSEKKGFYTFIDDNQDMLFLSKIWFKTKAFQQFGLQDNPQFQKDCIKKLKQQFKDNLKFQMIHDAQSIVRQLIKLKTIQKLAREKELQKRRNTYKKLLKSFKRKFKQQDFNIVFKNRIDIFSIESFQIYWMQYDNNSNQKDYIRIVITKMKKKIDQIQRLLIQNLKGINMDTPGVSKMFIKDKQYFSEDKVTLTIDIDLNFMPLQALRKNKFNTVSYQNHENQQQIIAELQKLKIRIWLKNILLGTKSMSNLQFYPTSLIKEEDICFQQPADSDIIKYYFNPYFAILQSIFNQQYLKEPRHLPKRQYPYHMAGVLLKRIIERQKDRSIIEKDSAFWNECIYLSQQMILCWDNNRINEESIWKFCAFPIFKGIPERILFYKTFYNLMNRQNEERYFSHFYSTQWKKMNQLYFADHFQKQAKNILNKSGFIGLSSNVQFYYNIRKILQIIRNLFCHNTFFGNNRTAIQGFKNDHEKLKIIERTQPKLMTFLYKRWQFLNSQRVQQIWRKKTEEAHGYHQFAVKFNYSYQQSFLPIVVYRLQNLIRNQIDISQTNYGEYYNDILQLRKHILRKSQQNER